jgi:uncharacterized protein YnzC (UPF0291/DUF896 family)
MFRFFRKIKKSLIESGNAKRYFLYATGEIILVVFGILIALQINNWNEDRKNSKKEKIVLKELITTLEKNNEIVNERLTYIEKFKASGLIILDVLDEKIPYSDTLHSHFVYAQFSGLGNLEARFSEAGYNALKLAGYEIIKSDSLKLQIIEMFETYLPVLSSYEPETQSKMRDYYLQNFKNEMVPNDFETLKNDSYYYEMVRFMINFRNRMTRRINEYLETSEGLIQNLEAELKNLE